MTQVMARVDDELAAGVDDLVERGIVASRSDAIRIGLERLVDGERRRAIGAAIARGYTEIPQTPAEVGWLDESTIRMIGEESW